MRISQSLAKLPAIKARAQIPAHKRKAQWVQTVIGGTVAVAAFFLRWKLGMPWGAVYVMAFAGGFTASKQLVLDILKAIPQAVAALAGKGGTDDSRGE